MNNILITGSPGIGKTTLIKKLIDVIKSKEMECDGFYTEEIKNNNCRQGFDIVTLNGKRGVLARKNSPNINMPMVGQYVVHINEFEEIALPIFNKPKRIMIIDEIGKMEMFSKKFQEEITSLFGSTNINVIATVPLKGGPLLVKQLKERKNCNLITIDRLNRDYILSDIVKLCEENYK